MVDEQIGRRVLIVDDDEPLLRAHARALTRQGFEVEAVTSGGAAEEAIQRTSYGVILSDIDMPGMDGITLLEHIRRHDLDVPVIMITGAPSMDTAIKAMEYGALRYLVKPVDLNELGQVASDAVRLHRLAKAKRRALELAGGVEHLVGDRAGLVASFSRAMDTLYIDYQPIVSWSNRTVFAYEALLRSREPSLPHPGAILEAAERLGSVHELGRRIRDRAIAPIASLPENALLFLNLHPDDLLDAALLAADTPLAAVADRVVLEITERSSLHGLDDVQGRIASLRKLGFKIAIDDLGAGYAGLTSFALLEPDIVKLDMALVRNLHLQPTKQTLVRTMVTMCKELGIVVTTEGIETLEERDELVRAGCDLMQGYLFARPGAPFPNVTF
ncbi:MAG: EAL domain-containing protein [Labilithrix sp.]